MNILWDLRLFSLAYGKKGVGQYTKSLCTDFLERKTEHEVFILGQKDHIPLEINTKCKNIINYDLKTWKHDLLHIPKIIKKFKIDLLHYWIALGPIHQMGLGFNVPCKIISNIHDLSVEQWTDIKWLKEKQKSCYWRTQKSLIKQTSHLIFNSKDTKKNYFKVFKNKNVSNNILYPKISLNFKSADYNNTLITLGGSETKNLDRTIEAFSIFNKEYNNYSLIVPGNSEEVSHKYKTNNNIQFVNFNEYENRLSKASAFLAFSLHEGLGIPPIEAMSLGVPSAVSNIAPFKETLKDSAAYADPKNLNDMISAIKNITENRKSFADKTSNRYKEYQKLTDKNGESILSIYENLFSLINT